MRVTPPPKKKKKRKKEIGINGLIKLYREIFKLNDIYIMFL